MRYAVFNGGKRMRPLLVYATGETLGVDPSLLDAPAAAIELIHAFSLVHDDLPAMDNDALRRGQPTVHIAFDEATAILAADALQPLAFELLARSAAPETDCKRWLDVIELVAAAAGSLGMTGGQAIDLEAEGRELELAELESMHAMKTGCLIRASVESACALSGTEFRAPLVRFSQALGLAFQVRDDILDIEGETAIIGKTSGADAERQKATWPARFGLAEAKLRCKVLFEEGLVELGPLGSAADPLRWLASYIIERDR